MLYAILAKEEWIPAEEGYPENTFCIVILNDAGEIPQDELILRYTGAVAGVGHVHSYDNGRAELMAIIPIPLDVTHYYRFDTESEAIHYALTQYYNDTVAVTTTVNDQIALNTFIDDLQEESIQRKKNIRYFWAFVAALVMLIIVLLLVILRNKLGLPPLFH